MNPTEQKARRTAIVELRADMEKVLDEYTARVSNELAGYTATYKREMGLLEARLRAEIATAEASAIKTAANLSEPIRRGFWGRMKWWGTGW